MAVKLGNTEASLYLGSAPAAGYLGAVQVAARTLYYNAAVNTSFLTVGNWWLDAAFTVQAGSLPTAADDVIVSASSVLGNGLTVRNLTQTAGGLGSSVTVTGIATFNADGYTSSLRTLTGNAVFNGTAANVGTINGNATFNDSSTNTGTVTGTITDNR
jgi:hypothetical protein